MHMKNNGRAQPKATRGQKTMAAAMEQPLQPELVQSVTDDDDNSSVGGHEKTMEYLLRYETMVRQQDAEDMATLAASPTTAVSH